MKLFGWMQNKLTGKQGNTKPNPVPPTRHVKQDFREEFSDWPNGLLAIGTFGNNDLRRTHEIQDVVERDHHQRVDTEEEEEDSASPSDDLQDFTPEEIGNLQKELTKLLSRKPTSDNNKKEKEIASLPLDRFLNCPSSLEISRRMSNTTLVSEVDEKEEDHIERTISIILDRCKDICESKKKSIGRKSISFLLKKMFVCRSGFAPQPSLRDTFQESRMEKLLRTLLHKKINSQNPPRSPSMKKYLEDKQTSTKEKEEDDPKRVKIADGSKWVKTDSEYIVLEI